MNIPPRIYLAFLGTILIPGIILGVLALRTIQNETDFEKQRQAEKKTEFLRYIEETVLQQEKDFLEKIKSNLIRTNLQSPEARFYLFTDFLKLPSIHSIVLIENERQVLPREQSLPKESRGFTPTTQKLLDEALNFKLQSSWDLCIERLNLLADQPNISDQWGYMGTSAWMALHLLKLQCLEGKGSIELAQEARNLVHSLFTLPFPIPYPQLSYVFSQAITLLGSIPNQSNEKLDEIWDLRQRGKVFFSNVDKVWNHWENRPEFLMNARGKSIEEGLEIIQLPKQIFLKVSFPWLETGSYFLMELNPQSFLGPLGESKKTPPPWQYMDYQIKNISNQVIREFNSPPTLPTSETEWMSTKLLNWQIQVLDFQNKEQQKLQQRKILALYTLLGFSFLTLIFGSLIILKGVLTERKNIKMQTNFLSAVTHELKSPLTSIRLLSEILESGKQKDDARIKNYASLIGKEARRLHSLIENILNKTRLENLKKVEFSLVSLDKLIYETIHSLEQSYHEKQVELECPELLPCEIKGHELSLQSLVQNLLENALKYTPPKGKVTLGLEKSQQEAIFTVTDTGIGIPEKYWKDIYKPFFRIENELTRESKGTGLGLSLVKNAVDLHKGHIKITSKNQNGTTFTVILPLDPQKKNYA